MIVRKILICREIRYVSVIIISFLLINIYFLSEIDVNSQAETPKDRIPLFAGLNGDNVIILDNFNLFKFDMNGNKKWEIKTTLYGGLLTSNTSQLVGSYLNSKIIDENGDIKWERPYGIQYYASSDDGSIIYERKTSTFFKNTGEILFSQNENNTGLSPFFSISGDGSTVVNAYTSSAGYLTSINALNVNGEKWEHKLSVILNAIAISFDGLNIFLGTTKGLFRFEQHKNEFNYSKEEFVEIKYMLSIDELSISHDGSVIAAMTNEGIYVLNNMVTQNNKLSCELVSVSKDGQTILGMNYSKLIMYDNNLNLIWQSQKLSRNNIHYNNDISIINGDSVVLAVTEGYVYVFDKMGNELWFYKGKHDIYNIKNNDFLDNLLLIIISVAIIFAIPVLIYFWRTKILN